MISKKRCCVIMSLTSHYVCENKINPCILFIIHIICFPKSIIYVVYAIIISKSHNNGIYILSLLLLTFKIYSISWILQILHAMISWYTNWLRYWLLFGHYIFMIKRDLHSSYINIIGNTKCKLRRWGKGVSIYTVLHHSMSSHTT